MAKFAASTFYELQIQTFCFDDFSGTRKLIPSEQYTDKDICDGRNDPASLVRDESVSQANEEDDDEL